MAQKVSIILTDDLDGTEASESITYSLDGTQYEIDLSEKHAADLRKAFEKYISVSRKVGRASKTTGGRSSSRNSSGVDPKAVRAWAEGQGIEISARGRVPSEVIEKYKAAGN